MKYKCIFLYNVFSFDVLHIQTSTPFLQTPAIAGPKPTGGNPGKLRTLAEAGESASRSGGTREKHLPSVQLDSWGMLTRKPALASLTLMTTWVSVSWMNVYTLFSEPWNCGFYHLGPETFILATSVGCCFSTGSRKISGQHQLVPKTSRKTAVLLQVAFKLYALDLPHPGEQSPPGWHETLSGNPSLDLYFPMIKSWGGRSKLLVGGGFKNFLKTCSPAKLGKMNQFRRMFFKAGLVQLWFVWVENAEFYEVQTRKEHTFQSEGGGGFLWTCCFTWNLDDRESFLKRHLDIKMMQLLCIFSSFFRFEWRISRSYV